MYLKKQKYVDIYEYERCRILFNRKPTYTFKSKLYHTYQGTQWKREEFYLIGIGMGNIWEKPKRCIRSYYLGKGKT